MADSNTQMTRLVRTTGGPKGYVDHGLAAVAEPFKGITTDGTLIPNLFPVAKSGVSTRPIREAAEAFLAALDSNQRTQTLFPIDTVEWRKWSNIHVTLMRHGIPIFEMNDRQQVSAFGLMQASLSAQGFQTARDVMRLNETVKEMTDRLDEYGEDLYWFSIMGTPSDQEPWGWQLDGHHLNLSYFVLGDQTVMTPTFLGSEPVHAKVGKYTGTRVFEQEEQEGLEMIRALTAEQRSQAIFSTDLPGGLFTAAFRDNFEMRYEGIRYNDLSPAQHDHLFQLIQVHIGRQRPDQAQQKMAEITGHLKDTYFGWAGGIEDDSVFYYRVHSPVILIEFDHERGIAFPVEKPYKDHIHLVVRTPNGNDYGKDLLRQHYEQSHGGAPA